MNKLFRLVSWFVLLAMILSACSPAAPTAAPTEVSTQASATEAPQPTNTTEAMATATQEAVPTATQAQASGSTVAPALIETPMIRGNSRTRLDLVAVGRFGTIDEVADVVAMLAVRLRHFFTSRYGSSARHAAGSRRPPRRLSSRSD